MFFSIFALAPSAPHVDFLFFFILFFSSFFLLFFFLYTHIEQFLIFFHWFIPWFGAIAEHSSAQQQTITLEMVFLVSFF